MKPPATPHQNKYILTIIWNGENISIQKRGITF